MIPIAIEKLYKVTILNEKNIGYLSEKQPQLRRLLSLLSKMEILQGECKIHLEFFSLDTIKLVEHHQIVSGTSVY